MWQMHKIVDSSFGTRQRWSGAKGKMTFALFVKDQIYRKSHDILDTFNGRQSSDLTKL